jgi:hypothetical protein
MERRPNRLPDRRPRGVPGRVSPRCRALHVVGERPVHGDECQIYRRPFPISWRRFLIFRSIPYYRVLCKRLTINQEHNFIKGRSDGVHINIAYCFMYEKFIKSTICAFSTHAPKISELQRYFF